MRKNFRIVSLALAGMAAISAPVTGAAPISTRTDDDTLEPSSLFDALRALKPNPLFKQHRSHQSHQSHGSHRSSSGGSRPPRTVTPSPTTPRSPRPAESDSTAPSSVLPSTGSVSLDALTSDQRQLARVQAMLSGYGYYMGDVDGVDGPLTRLAIRRFQAVRRLTVTGTVTSELLDELGIATE